MWWVKSIEIQKARWTASWHVTVAGRAVAFPGKNQIFRISATQCQRFFNPHYMDIYLIYYSSPCAPRES